MNCEPTEPNRRVAMARADRAEAAAAPERVQQRASRRVSDQKSKQPVLDLMYRPRKSGCRKNRPLLDQVRLQHGLERQRNRDEPEASTQGQLPLCKAWRKRWRMPGILGSRLWFRHAHRARVAEPAPAVSHSPALGEMRLSKTPLALRAAFGLAQRGGRGISLRAYA